MSLASLHSFSAICKGVRHIDVPKLAFFAACALLIFGYGVAVGKYAIFPYMLLKHVQDSVEQVWGERDTVSGTRPEHLLQPSRYKGSGVTVNKNADPDSLILISGFFGDVNEIRLIQRDGTIVARWPLHYSEIFPDSSHLEQPPLTDWNVDTHGALALPDGSVVFNFDYTGLVKLDRCGNVVWTVNRQTHHSVERAEGGGFWVPGQWRITEEQDSPYRPFETPLDDHTIMKVSDDGEILSELSAIQFFYDNNLEAVLTSSASAYSTKDGSLWGEEIIHLNKITELSSDIADDFPLFDDGDLMLSMYQLNLIMVVDPDTHEIKWWKIGPWLRQHDPEFKAGGTIVVFNNNAYKDNLVGRTSLSAPRETNIMEMDPVSGQYRILYGGQDSQEMLSVTRGKVDITPDGGLLITEFEGGRVLETNAEGELVWEYINRFSTEEVAEVSEARLYPRSYFSVSDWSCPSRSS